VQCRPEVEGVSEKAICFELATCIDLCAISRFTRFAGWDIRFFPSPHTIDGLQSSKTRS